MATCGWGGREYLSGRTVGARMQDEWSDDPVVKVARTYLQQRHHIGHTARSGGAGLGACDEPGVDVARTGAKAAVALTLFQPERVRAVRRSGLLERRADDRFDRATRLAATAIAAPVALLVFLDDRRQVVASDFGVD